MDLLKQLMGLCKCGVHVTMNAHRDYYESVSVYLKDVAYRGMLKADDAIVNRMVETNTIIEVQAYPDTPIGFVLVFHHDLDEALREAVRLVGEKRGGTTLC